MSDSKQAVGSCTEISEKNGWTTFSIDVGTKYPLKLATKKADVISAARAAGSALSTWTYNEVESDKTNEHTGKPYINRYLEAVTGALPDTPASSGSTTPQEPPRTGLLGADRDRAIVRQSCLKAAAETFKAFPGIPLGGETSEPLDAGLEVMKLAQRYENWVMRDLSEVPF